MKPLITLSLLFTVLATLTNCSVEKGVIEKQQDTVHLGKVQVSERTDIERPLVCGKGKDFPDGAEVIVTTPEKDVVHVVFPDRRDVPESNIFKLSGYYQTIQNLGSYSNNQPDSTYKYFVATEIVSNQLIRK